MHFNGIHVILCFGLWALIVQSKQALGQSKQIRFGGDMINLFFISNVFVISLVI
jgi:hypothetical protein